MHPAEIIIRRDIQELTLHRLAPRTESIKSDIKYAFWHGFIDEYKYNLLHDELDKRRVFLFDEDSF